jgi:hypothetical protein
MVQTRVRQIWKLRASNQLSRRPFPRSRRAKPLYGNYLQQKCDRQEDRASPSRRGSKTGKSVCAQSVNKIKTVRNLNNTRIFVNEVENSI